MSVVTRFAPSPTGHLHIGGARTALFSWLVARKAGGQFILRIEDTDRERSEQQYVDAIIEGMAWLGLDHDGDLTYQTQRFDRYAAVIDQLIADGHAYHCYCSKQELDERRDAQRANGEKPRYDGRCRTRTAPREGVQPVVRFKNPDAGDVVFTDLIRGDIRISNTELDDLIIARSDGTPTYNLTVVVDDLDMGLTHVVRGDDHINNTPRQINLYHALGAQPPAFAHVPMILGSDGKRLSKRHGAVSVLQYRDEGFLPQALLNYLVRLGWSHGDQEMFSRAELLAHFELNGVNKAASTFNPDKLLWLNQQYFKTLPAADIAEHLQWHCEKQALNISDGPALEAVIETQRERAKTLLDMVAAIRFFYEDFAEYDAKAARKNLKPEAVAPLQHVHDQLAVLTDWQAEPIHQCVHHAAEQLDLKLGKVAQPIRVAVSGGGVSPSIDITLELLGRQRTLARLQRAIEYAQTPAE